jgi:hypothetical protein
MSGDPDFVVAIGGKINKPTMENFDLRSSKAGPESMRIPV